jgi:hypothetical protein
MSVVAIDERLDRMKLYVVIYKHAVVSTVETHPRQYTGSWYNVFNPIHSTPHKFSSAPTAIIVQYGSLAISSPPNTPSTKASVYADFDFTTPCSTSKKVCIHIRNKLPSRLCLAAKVSAPSRSDRSTSFATCSSAHTNAASKFRSGLGS